MIGYDMSKYILIIKYVDENERIFHIDEQPRDYIINSNNRSVSEAEYFHFYKKINWNKIHNKLKKR